MSVDKKITQFTELTTPADDDLLVLVDVSDTTHSTGGTTKKAEVSNVRGWPQTSAESSAGVTPTNLQYEPGNVLRYGTNTTPGTTDMQAAIQAAIDQAGETGGADVYIPAGRYLTGSALTGTTDIIMRGDGIGKSVIEPSGSFVALTLGNDTAAATTTTTAATAINVGDQSFGLTSATGVAAGQIIVLTSGAAWYYETANSYKKGELHVIDSLSGSTVRLFDSVYDSYETTETIAAVAYNAVNVDLRDFEILYASNTTTGGLTIQYAVDSYVSNVKVSGNNKASMGTIGCVGVVFDGCVARGANDSPNGFGFSVTDSNNVIITNAHIENCVFGADLGTGTIPCRNNQLTRSVIVGGGYEQDGTTLLNTVSVGAETHGAGENCSFTNNKIINCQRGILAKGSNTTVQGNEFIGCVFEAVYFQHGANLSVIDNTQLDMTTDRTDVGSGATATPFQRCERFITVEGDNISTNSDLDVRGNKASCQSRFMQLAGTSNTHSNFRIYDNHVDLYGQTGGTSVLFMGGTGGSTIDSGRINNNTVNVEQGTYTAVDSSIVGVGGIGPEPAVLVTTTNVIGAAETGTTFFLNAAGGFTSTLPSPEIGLKYKFIVSTAPTSSYVITTNGGANILQGTYLDIVGELVSIASQDTLNFVGGTSLIGDSLTVECDGASWHCTAFSKADGGITVSVT